MSGQVRDDAEFWDDLAAIVDGETDALEKHADLLADSDAHRDARHEAERAANVVADAGLDYEAPSDMEARVLDAIGEEAQPEQPVEDAGSSRATEPDSSVAEPAQGEAPASDAGATQGSEPTPDAPKAAPKPSDGGKVILLFGGLAAAAALLLAVVGIGAWSIFGGDDEGEPQLVQPGAGALSGRIARVERAADDDAAGVTVRVGESGTFTDIRAGQEVPAGATVRTDERTRVLVELSDGSAIVLNHGTQVELDPDDDRQLRLSTGELVADVAHLEQGPRAVYVTPSGRVEVLGTKFVLTATDELATVRVTRGVVRAHAATGGTVEVKAGEEGVMPKAGQPSVAPAMNLARAVSWSELGGEEETDGGIRGLGELRARRPGEREEQERPLTLAHHAATVRVVGNVARTEIEETFQNDSEHTLEGIYKFPLPPDARIASLSLKVDGEWEQGAFVERDRAQRIWRGVIRNATPERQRQRQEEFIWVPGPWRDPALLEWQRGGNFELRIFPIPANGSRSIRIAYEQNIAPNGAGGRRYVHPLAHSGDDSTRVGRFELDLRVTGNDGEVTPHGYPMQVSREDNATRVRYAADGFLPAGDLMVDYHLANESELLSWTFQGQATAAPPERTREGSQEVLEAHRSAHTDSRGYVVFALRPELPAWTEGRSRDYVLVVDASQSMVGERYERAKRLAAGVVGEMDRRDRFVVLACDATCQTMSETPQHPSAQTAADVTGWLESVQPAGASDLSAAMRGAVAALEGKRNADRDVRIVYFGDGVASVGPRRAGSLSAEVADAVGGDEQMTVTTVGIGGDADTMTLSAMARAGGGHYVPYVPGQRVGSAALAVLETTYGVSLTNAELDLPDGVVDVAPRRLPTIRAGEEVIVTGRLARNDVRGEVTLRGEVGGRDFSQRYPVALTASTARGNAFVPRLWASASIEQLQLDGRGEDTAKIIGLSKAYGVMSRHTSLLVLESAAMFRAFGVDRAQPSIQWTGEEDMEMGASEGLDALGDGRTDVAGALAGASGIGGLGTLGRGSAASTRGGGGFAQAPARRRARRPAPRPRSSSDSRALDDLVAEESAGADEAALPRREGERPAPEPEPAAQPAAQAPPPRPTPRRGRGSWMRRQWYRVGSVTTDRDVPQRDRDALAEAEAALRASPDSRDRHRDVVRAASRVGDLDRAYEVAEAWIERDRLDPEALTYLADVLGRQGKRDQAVRLLSGVVDLKPDDRILHERMANAFERAGIIDRACAHRQALAEIRSDDAEAQGAALSCQRSLGRDAAAQRILEAQPDDRTRTRVEREASQVDGSRRARGRLMLDASWNGSSDLDIALITPQGTRLSWMGGRRAVVGDDGSAIGRERLGLRSASVGSYVIEISRVDPSDTTPVSGRIRVRAYDENRTLRFELGEREPRAAVGRVRVRRESRMVPVR